MEHGIYGRLLDIYYSREGAIPAEQAARLVGARTEEEKAAVDCVLTEFFDLGPAGWTQSRCDAEIDRFHHKQAQAKRAAQASVASRQASAERPLSGRSTDVERTQSPDPDPVTKEKTSVAIATGAKPPPEEIVFGYGVPLLVTAGTAEKHARSFLGKLLREHGPPAVVDALRDCIRAKPLQPLEWLAAALPPKGKSANRQEAIEKANRAVGDRWLAETEQAHAIY